MALDPGAWENPLGVGSIRGEALGELGDGRDPEGMGISSPLTLPGAESLPSQFASVEYERSGMLLPPPTSETASRLGLGL